MSLSARHVIVVDWDAFDPSYLGRVPMPQLEALAARGSLSIARGTFPTITNPAHASIVTGAYPEVHENAAYYYDEEARQAVGQSRALGAETIAQALAAQGRSVAAVQWHMVHGHGTAFGDPEHLYVQPGGPFAARVDAAIEILERRAVRSGGGKAVTVPRIPDLLAVYSSDLDGEGHRAGAEGAGLAPLLAEHDRQLGRLVQATKDVGIHGETTFVLTGDHGMTTWDRSLLPQVTEAIRAAGYEPEIVRPPAAAAPATEAVIVPVAVRIGDISLRGRAARPEGIDRIATALEALAQITRVLNRRDLRRLRASSKLGDLVAEAEPPWAFALADGEPHGSHGALSEIDVPLLLAGAGVRAGIAPRAPRLVDVAPTIAALLGTRPPRDAQGRALVEALALRPSGENARGPGGPAWDSRARVLR